jgi:hypothetical protein
MCEALAIAGGLVVLVGLGVWGYIYGDLHGRIVH